MKTPMIVGWLARRSGVAPERGEELWRDAVRHATVATGWVGTPEYHAAAVERFRALIAAESPAAWASPALVPLVRAHSRVCMMPLLAWQSVAVIATRTWGKLALPRAA